MPRASTVYDLTSLQIHADGRRVKQVKTNRPTSLTAPHSYRVAGDVGGPSKLPRGKGVKNKDENMNKKKRKREKKDVDGVTDDVEDFTDALKSVEELLKVDDGEKVLDQEMKDSKEVTFDSRLHDRRTIKRRKYEQNMDFLSPKRQQPHPQPTASSSRTPPDDFPSSHLLKNIHWFASQYYTSRGQLYNHAQSVRKADHARKRRRQGLDEDADDEGEEDDLVNEEEEEEDERDDADDLEPSKPTQTRSQSRNRSHQVRAGVLEKLPHTKGKYKKVIDRRKEAASKDRIGNWEPDMYKMMDGSALVCLGMLVQEYVRWQVRAGVPEDWNGVESEGVITKEVASQSLAESHNSQTQLG